MHSEAPQWENVSDQSGQPQVLSGTFTSIKLETVLEQVVKSL
jgi:hypothetical protein